MDLAVEKLEGSGRQSRRTDSERYSSSASLDILDMNLSNAACVSGISKSALSASSCTSGTLSTKASEGGAGGRWVPRNPEKKRYIQVYISYQLWYIHGISQSYVDVINMVGIYVVKHFWVCSIPFFIMIYLWYNLNIKRIFMEYQRYIIIKKGADSTEQTQKCFTTYIPSICMTSTYDWNTSCIYHVYTRQVVISQLYTRNIRCIYYIVYT